MPELDFTLPSSATMIDYRDPSLDYAVIDFKFEDEIVYNSFGFWFSEKQLVNVDTVPPNHIVSFTYEDTVNTSADKVNIELFDATWNKIENLIIEKKNNLFFRFGWSSGKKSRWKKVTIVSHTPTFEINGLRIAIEGYDSTVQSNDEAHTRDWRNYEYIHDIVKQIADENNWLYTNESIVNTKKIIDEDGKSKIFVQKQMGDLTFIKEELLKYAQTEDGKGGFICWYDVEDNTFYFKPPSYESPVAKTYLVHKDRFGQVISFSPDLGDGSLQRQIGAVNTRLINVDPFKREIIDIALNNKEATSEKILLADYIPDQNIKTKGGAGRFMHAAINTQESATIVAKQRLMKRFNMFFEAEMEVLGDPTIKPGSNIGIVVLDSEYRPFYCSGKFYVESATHTIDNGNYTTRLKLWKNAMRQGDINASLIEAGIIRKQIETTQTYFKEMIKQQTDSPFFSVPPVPFSSPAGYPTF